MKFKTVEGYVPESQKSARANIAYLQEKLDDVCEGMMVYATKDEFMRWVDEAYERAYDAYQDFLSRPSS